MKNITTTTRSLHDRKLPYVKENIFPIYNGLFGTESPKKADFYRKTFHRTQKNIKKLTRKNQKKRK